MAAITKAAAQAVNIMTLAGWLIDCMSASKSLIPIMLGAAPHVTSFTYVNVGQFALMQHIVYFTNSGPPSGGGAATVECASYRAKSAAVFMAAQLYLMLLHPPNFLAETSMLLSQGQW
jgi:hypothetical protein